MTIKILLSFTGIFKVSNSIDNIMIVIVILFFIADIFDTRYYTLREILICLAIGVLISYTCIITKNYYLIMSYLLIITSIKKDIMKVINMIYKVKSIYITFLIILYIVICLTTNYLDGEVFKDGRIALSLGFAHANLAGIILFWMIVEKVYMNYENINLQKIISILLQIIIIYLLTACKTVILIGSLFCFLLIINKKQVNKATKFIAKYVFIVLCIFVVFSMNIYKNQGGIFYNIIKQIDIFLTGRICIGAKLLSIYDWSIFGQAVKLGKINYDAYYGLTYITVDGMYIDFFIRSGVIYMLIINKLIFKYFSKDRPYIDYILVILFSIYGLLEMHGLYLVICFPILLISTDYIRKDKLIYKNNREHKDGFSKHNYSSI